MKQLLAVAFSIAVLIAALNQPCTASPVHELPRIDTDGLGQGTTSVRGSSGILGTASGPDTVYFGGTFWNADSVRWEAIQDSSWTFDSGVGSHFNHSAPHVNSFKDTTLHAVMEGWMGIDGTQETSGFFRRVNNADFPGSGQSACKVNGSNFFWCGVLPQEAVELCYASGQGYGNNWNSCIEQTFAYDGNGSVTFQYVYENDTELDFDFTYVYCDTTGNGDKVELASYSDGISGIGMHTLVPGSNLPSAAGPFVLQFCVVSDGAYSDEDGSYTTNCGAFAVDDISVSGGGINYSTDFETGDDGWIPSPAEPGLGGDWSDIVDVADLPPVLTDCVCNFSDSVLVFNDLNSPGFHNIWQNNYAASPWIDLKAAGLVGAPGKFAEMDLYADLPVLNYILAQFLVRWYPESCSGGGGVSQWITDGISHNFGGLPTCTQPGSPFRTDFSAIIPSGAEQVQFAVGIFSNCFFFANCTGMNNASPFYDNIKFGVCGTFGGGGATTPVLSLRPMDLPQDAFPEDGELALDSPGRVDSGTLRGAAEPGPNTSLGDSLVVLGGSGDALVFVQFSVDPGPGTDATALTNFLSTVTFEETKDGLDWYSARIDTAEQGGVPSPGFWMTAFHEDDPGFTGTDTDLDGSDLDPLGGTGRLENDVFPDDLFTPGTRLNVFYKTRFTAGAEWATLPDTSLGEYLEMEILPSSFNANQEYNCVLYVDHFDTGDAQEPIEDALSSVISSGSDNWENTGWDRYDVRGTNQVTFGRPSGTEYGATLDQALGYKTIIWNTGTRNAYTMLDEDAQILTPWLLAADSTRNNIYVSGDGLASSITTAGGTDPATLDLLNNVLGAELNCSTFSNLDCPVGTPVDLSTCVNLDPVGGGPVSSRPLGHSHQAQGNGCPQNRAFDVLSTTLAPTHGTPFGEEEYSTAIKTVELTSISSRMPGVYQSLVDGVSLHNRRTDQNCLHGSVTSEAMEGRLTEALSWFGYAGSLEACALPGTQVGIGDDPSITPRFTNGLANFSPNPLPSHRQGQIQFTLAAEAPARIDIYDLNGRLIQTVFDGTASPGVNFAAWDGTDAAGRPVASGVYFYSLRVEGEQYAQKLVVARN